MFFVDLLNMNAKRKQLAIIHQPTVKCATQSTIYLYILYFIERDYLLHYTGAHMYGKTTNQTLCLRCGVETNLFVCRWSAQCTSANFLLNFTIISLQVYFDRCMLSRYGFAWWHVREVDVTTISRILPHIFLSLCHNAIRTMGAGCAMCEMRHIHICFLCKMYILSQNTDWPLLILLDHFYVHILRVYDSFGIGFYFY